jgi:hypothetical protein
MIDFYAQNILIKAVIQLKFIKNMNNLKKVLPKKTYKAFKIYQSYFEN